MKLNVNGMSVFILKDYEEMSKKAAHIVMSQITLKPNSVLGLATGGTPLMMYQKKAQIIVDALLGPISPAVPASILQLHNDVTVILDKLATVSLLNKYHYKW